MIVTGESTSRLCELKKFAVNVPFSSQYVGGGTSTVDGVDYLNSTSGVCVTYYLGGMQFLDILAGDTSGTTFSFTAEGTGNTASFFCAPYFKDPKKENIISNPKITDDVFIIRQELSAFENNYRLEHIKNLNDLETYAGGKFFNIVNNT